MQPLIIDLLRWIHIITGVFALMSGPVAMFNQDGGKLHRQSGKIYLWSMTVIFTTSIILSIYRGNILLFLIGIFSMHLVITGYRALALKMLHRGQKAATIDWFILILSAVAGAGLCMMGAWIWGSKGSNFGMVPIVFGGVMLFSTVKDYYRYTQPPTEKNHWLIRHITGMMGGYIATITAFCVNNLHTDPAFISWLLPTVILVPFIMITTRKFRKGPGKIILP